MKKFKERWQITKNWQLIHPILGLVASLFSGYLISAALVSKISIDNSILNWILVLFTSLLFTYFIIQISIWCFKKLKNRWKVNYRWEYIAIFLCFAVTGSTAGRLSDPLMNLIGLTKDSTNGWIYWLVRIVLIFPIYQVLLLIFGWIFGQYAFFKAFMVKMLSRLGLSFIFGKPNG